MRPISYGMKKTNSKIFLIIVFIGALSLFFISNQKVLAQAENNIEVKTTGYSVLSAESFVFGGYYEGNVEKKGFTTYFQFKKDDANLDSKAEETIKIVRNTDVEEYNDFYSSPELNLFSTYYFRAVGYFNDNPNEKFYGNIMTLRTGYIPVGFKAPFYMDATSLVSYDVPIGAVVFWAKTEINKINEVQFSYTSFGGSDTDSVYTDVTFTRESLEKALATPSVSSIVSATTNLKNKLKLLKTSTENLDSPSPIPPSDEVKTGDTDLGLVPCDDSSTNPCGFDQIIKLINTVISFIFNYMVIPIAAIMFAYAGVLLITSGGETSKREHAKHIFISVAIGLILAAGAFIIVQTVLGIVGYDKSINWFGF